MIQKNIITIKIMKYVIVILFSILTTFNSFCISPVKLEGELKIKEYSPIFLEGELSWDEYSQQRRKIKVTKKHSGIGIGLISISCIEAAVVLPLIGNKCNFAIPQKIENTNFKIISISSIVGLFISGVITCTVHKKRRKNYLNGIKVYEISSYQYRDQ